MCGVLCEKTKSILSNNNFEIPFWPRFFFTEHHKFHFTTKLGTYVEHLYMFVDNFSGFFWNVLHFSIFSGQKYMSSGAISNFRDQCCFPSHVCFFLLNCFLSTVFALLNRVFLLNYIFSSQMWFSSQCIISTGFFLLYCILLYYSKQNKASVHSKAYTRLWYYLPRRRGTKIVCSLYARERCNW